MKAIISTLIAITYGVLALAQMPMAENSIIEKAEFVFEGKIIEHRSFYDTIIDNSEKVHGDIYTTYVIQIDKIFRGGDKFEAETIVIISPHAGAGFVVTEYGLMTIDYDIDYLELPASLPKHGIYFCDKYKDTKMDMLISIHPSLDVTKLELSSGSKNKTKFKSKQEIYEYLKKYKNITIPEEENIEPIKKKDASGYLDVISKENQIKYAQNVENHEKYMEFLQARIDIAAKKTGNSCEEPFISEMIEANAPNRALELFNPSDVAVDLSDFSIRLFQNGQLTPLIIPLSGTIPAKGTFVIAHQAAKPEIKAKADMLDPQLAFDGNDAIVLEKTGGTQVDKIGEIGVNPGNSGWSVPPNGSTKEQTLRRKYPIDKGETNWNQGKNQWTVHPKDSVSNLKVHQNACTAAGVVELFFEFDNPQVTGTDTLYFEFDITIRASNDSTFLESCFYVVSYNSEAFGTSIVDGNRVIATHDSAFNKPTYGDTPFILSDLGITAIQLATTVDVTQSVYDRTLVTTSPEPLVHLKVELLNCNKFTGLALLDVGINSQFSAYTLTSDDTINYGNTSIPLYDVTNYDGLLDTFPCGQGISNFTSPVYPGTWYQGTTTSEYLLTIQGIGFDTTRGNGNVYFKNANNGGQNYTLLDAYDFLSWTDSEIQIRMPSRIDTSLYSSTNRRIPGSGMFYVKTNTGDSLSSNTPIDMPYAIKNVGFPTSSIKKVRMDLIDPDKIDSVAITFELDTSITNHPNPMVEASVRAAIEDWACLTGAWFEIGAGTTIGSSSPDDVSVVHFVDSFTNSATLAVTTMHPSKTGICLDFFGDKHVWPKEIDIAILADPTTVGGGPWHFDTINAIPAGKIDFLEVMLHEVGHAVLLQHVNYNDLMFYKSLFDPIDSIPEFSRRYISANDQAGGIDVTVKGAGVALDPSACPSEDAGTLILLPADQSCVNLVSVKGLKLTTNSGINIYPNPAGNQGFNISYEFINKSVVRFRLIDYTGKEILTINKGYKSIGKYIEHIDTGPLASGMYFLITDINGYLHTNKVIKL